MDPDENLREQLKLASRCVEAYESDRPLHEADVYRMSELIIAMDEWIRNGGFLPKAWKEKQ